MKLSPTIAAAAFVFALGMTGTASAQSYSNDVMSRCSQTVGQMKFEGWGADRNREMMMSACQSNGGVIPGAAATQESPVALRHKGTARR